MSINLQEVSISLPTACGEGAEIKVDLAAMPTHIIESLISHGLKQKVADSVANAKKEGWTQTKSLETCQEVITTLLSGTWAKRGGGARINTLQAYILSEARKAAKARIEKDGEGSKAAEAGLEKVTEAYAKAPALRAQWEAEWNAKQAAKKEEVDLDL